MNARFPSAFLVLVLGTVVAATFSVTVKADSPAKEPPCNPGEQVGECLLRLAFEDGQEQAPQRTVTKTQTDLRETDLSTFGSSEVSGSLRPFLETFLAGLNGITSSGDGGELNLTYNSPSQRVSLEAVFHQAMPSEMLLEAYPEASRDQQKEALNKELDDLSDVETKLVFNFASTSGRYGRRIQTYANELSALVSEVVTGVDFEKKKLQKNAFGLVGEVLGEELIRDKSVGEATWSEVKDSGDPALIARVRSLLLDESLRRRIADAHFDFLEVVNRSGIERFYELVANQPQRYLELGGRFRDEEVGESTWSTKFVWEIPAGSNVNGLKSYCKHEGYGAVSLACYNNYLDLAETQDSLNSKDRFKLEIAATGVSAYRFEDPDHDVLIESGSEVKATLAAGYSRVLRYVEIKADATTGEPAKKVEASRFDAEVAGEYVNNEEVFQRRLKATVTLTNRLTDTFDAALSFVWASEPEFRGEVDQEFSVRAGLRLRVGQTGK